MNNEKQTTPCSGEVKHVCKNDYGYIIVIVLYILLAIILGACLNRY